MASMLHDTVAEMFRHRPGFAADLLGGVLGLSLPGFTDAGLGAVEVIERIPVEHRADVVVVLRDAGRPALGVVVEVQLGRDDDKGWTWPDYVGAIRNRLRCDAVLLVVCPDAATARWAARPIPLGNPGSALVPTVLGPDAIPVVTDRVLAATVPELAVLSAIVHGGDPDRAEVLSVLMDALAQVETEHAVDYIWLVAALLPQIARARLEDIMSVEEIEFQTEFFRRMQRQSRTAGLAEGHAEGHAEGRAEGRAEGHAEGRAEAAARGVQRILEQRGIAVPEPARRRIVECRDVDQLDVWFDRALTAATVDDVFG